MRCSSVSQITFVPLPYISQHDLTPNKRDETRFGFFPRGSQGAPPPEACPPVSEPAEASLAPLKPGDYRLGSAPAHFDPRKRQSEVCVRLTSLIHNDI